MKKFKVIILKKKEYNKLLKSIPIWWRFTDPNDSRENVIPGYSRIKYVMGGIR
jgi:hypothetical protein